MKLTGHEARELALALGAPGVVVIVFEDGLATEATTFALDEKTARRIAKMMRNVDGCLWTRDTHHDEKAD